MKKSVCKRTMLMLVVGYTIIALVAIMVLLKIATYHSVKRIQEHERMVIAEYSSTIALQSLEQREEFFDRMEEFLHDNLLTLLIISYNRNDSSIVVNFASGQSYIIVPLVDGYY